MELQMNASYADHTAAWVFFILSLACFALAGISALWWKLAEDNEKNRKKAKTYETAEMIGLFGGVGLVMISGLAWLFCEMSVYDAPRKEAISQIEQEYGFTLNREQRNVVESALSGGYVDPVDDGKEDAEQGSQPRGYGANSSWKGSLNPYQEPVPLGSVWIERDDGSLVKGTFSFMLKKTADDGVIVFDLVMPSESTDAVQRISPEEVREHANSIKMDGDVSKLFESAEPEDGAPSSGEEEDTASRGVDKGAAAEEGR